MRHGWNYTGDTYIRDEDGYFWYQARSDDMIISSGYNIAGPEVENALLRHPAVLEAGVIGMPDPDRGQLVTAFVVLRPGRAPTGEAARQGPAGVREGADRPVQVPARGALRAGPAPHHHRQAPAVQAPRSA